MGESSPPPEKPSSTPESPRGGIDIRGGDVRAGHDIVAGDVNVAGDSISGQTVSVQRGYSANEVQRLILIVGGLVFATALCFFIFGAVSSVAVVTALNRPIDSTTTDAKSMQSKIQQMNALNSGDQFRVGFTETEISSYFRFILGPNVHVSNGKVRIMDTPGDIAIGGNLDQQGGLPFAAQLSLTTDAKPFQLKGAWIKILPTPEGSNVGWIPVTPFAQSLTDQLNGLLFGRVQFTQVRKPSIETGGRSIILDGVAK